ncbi:MAG: 5-carboxymethyl-2-hydroxymuconate isomerase [Flavobacteriales bacterium]|jgi:5-carboxymethyl-2-hydroxymuconate isomerase
MPHCIIEYAKEVEQSLAVNALLLGVHQTVVGSQLFEEQSIKTRAIAYEHYLIGGDKKPFIHITLKILFGRNHQQKKDLTKSVLDTLTEVVQSPISLSVEVMDIDKVSYKKLVI